MSGIAGHPTQATPRILICHRLNLGDLVLASPGIQWYRRRNPHARLRLLTNDFAARVGELLPGVEHVVRYAKFGGEGLPEWRALLAVHRWRPDSVIGLAPTPDWRLDLRVRLLGARSPAPAPDSSPPHVAEKLAWLFGWRGGEPLPPARLEPPPARGTVRNVAIWVSARKPSNRPGAGQIVEIVRALRARRAALTIGVFGLPAQTDSAAHVPDAGAQSMIGAALKSVGLALETPPFERLLAELAASETVITPDGGIAHIAAGFGKPVVALFGNVNIDAWRPYSPLARNLQASSRMVIDLQAAEIAAAWDASAAGLAPPGC